MIGSECAFNRRRLCMKNQMKGRVSQNVRSAELNHFTSSCCWFLFCFIFCVFVVVLESISSNTHTYTHTYTHFHISHHRDILLLQLLVLHCKKEMNILLFFAFGAVFFGSSNSPLFCDSVFRSLVQFYECSLPASRSFQFTFAGHSNLLFNFL